MYLLLFNALCLKLLFLIILLPTYLIFLWLFIMYFCSHLCFACPSSCGICVLQRRSNFSFNNRISGAFSVISVAKLYFLQLCFPISLLFFCSITQIVFSCVSKNLGVVHSIFILLWLWLLCYSWITSPTKSTQLY